MVEKLRGNDEEDEKVILSKLAEEICKKQGWDKSYGDFKDDPETEDKLKTIRKALKIAFERDRKLYFGE